MHNTSTQNQKVLIIGGGIAGLLTARVLAEAYDEVLVIERDGQPEKPEPRVGAPQSFHLHQVLPSGAMLMERLFPGCTDDLLALGAFCMQDTSVQWTNRYGTMVLPVPEKMANYSRSLLEWFLRQRVHALPNVRFLYQQEITGLETTPDRTRVTGVYARQRGQLEQQTTLSADLVIDASGRFSKLPQWLSALGYALPEDECLTTAVGYTTRNYKMSQSKENVASVIVLENDPTTGNPLGGVLKVIEGDIWAVCLSSIGGHYPPTDAKGFAEGFARLINPRLAEIVGGAEPLTEPRGYRIPECVRHHYEQMEQWPTGLLVLGDALCCLDPVYGQGMTVAAIEAETLANCLREEQGPSRSGFERRVLQRLQDANYPAWWLSAIEDLRWPSVTYNGHEPIKGLALLHKYFDLCLKRMTQQFQQPPTGEFNPLFMNYLLMNALVVPPHEVINTSMLDALLAHETPEGKQAIIADLLQGYDQPIGTVLAEILPTFSITLATQPEELTSESTLAS